MSILFNNAYSPPPNDYKIYGMTLSEAQSYHSSFQGGYVIKNLDEKFRLVWLRSNIDTSYEYCALQLYCDPSIMNLGSFTFSSAPDFSSNVTVTDDGRNYTYQIYGGNNSYYKIYGTNFNQIGNAWRNFLTYVANRYSWFERNNNEADRIVYVRYAYSTSYERHDVDNTGFVVSFRSNYAGYNQQVGSVMFTVYADITYNGDKPVKTYYISYNGSTLFQGEANSTNVNFSNVNLGTFPQGQSVNISIQYTLEDGTYKSNDASYTVTWQ